MKAFLLAILLMVLGSSAVFATTFPMPELGNCRDANECHLYCEVDANKPACWAVSQSQVLGDATDSAAPKPRLVFPIADLGNCQNATECKAYCEVAEHHTLCEEFARTHGLGKPSATSSLVERAKTELGCTTLTACKAVCEQPANQDKCHAFTLKFASPAIKKQVTDAESLLQSIEKDFACTSKDSCMQACKLPENKSRCEALLKAHLPKQTVEQKRQDLKANCTTADECRAWCTAHPDLCPTVTSHPATTSSELHTTTPL